MPPTRSRPRTPDAEGAAPPPSVGILDVAFRRAQRASPHGTTKAERDRLRAKLKIVRSSATVLRHLRLEQKPVRAAGEFETTLVAGAFGAGVLERTLTRLRRAEERIRRLTREAESGLRRADSSEELGEHVRRFYGRLASFVREVDPDLERARAIGRYLADRPKLDLERPRLVVAGFPNVGKSSLVARLSSARPKVAAYPFTTVAISVGHADLGFDRLQIVDTPGVLNRAVRENPAEVEAEATVAGAATAVLFVLDPSGSSGYTLEEQERLLERWRAEFPGLEIVPVETKSDLVRRPTDRLRVSAVTGEGIEELRQELERRLLPPRPAKGQGPVVVDIPDESEASGPADSSSRRGRRASK